MKVAIGIRVFATALLAMASTAFAGGPLQSCLPTGQSVRVPVKYPGAGTVTLSYDQGSLGARSKAEADALVTAAVSNWTNVATSTVNLARGADLPVDVTTANQATYLGVFNDGINPVVYDTDGTIVDLLLGTGARNSVLGFAGSGFSSSTCAFVEGRAVINGFIPVTDATMRVVLAHEVGHLIGMDHAQLDDEQGLDQSNYPLMYPIAFRATDALHEDDAAAVSALYPDTNVAAVYGQLTGTLHQADGVTLVRGANIWAKEVGTGKLYSTVSDYLQNVDGSFRLLLPPGNYNLFVGAVRPGFTEGSSVGPYSEASTDLSFQPPLYDAGVRMTAVALGGGTPTAFAITAGCLATANNFSLNGTGTVGGNCGSPGAEFFPANGTMPAGFVPGASQQRDLFANAGFESDLASWNASGGWIAATSLPFAGAKHAQFSLPDGTAGNSLTGDLFQTVSIPAGVSAAAVLYQLEISTQETDPDAFDLMQFQVRNAAGTLLATAPPHSNLNAGAYRPVGWNVVSFAGQTVRINFSALTDEIFPTRFRLDDVSLLIQAAPAWTVAVGEAQEGIYSLRSGMTPEGMRSDLVHSATFVAGTVSFARKVSSQQNGDFLRFYIDDVQQGQWSGEVDWSVVSFPVPAGVHTLRWSYEKDASVTAGSDAAWIDTLVLPGQAGPMHQVTVAKAGLGSGAVTSSPAGINCGSTCAAPFEAGAVTLTATPAGGSTFAGWSGACSGTGSCNLTVSAPANVTATFDVAPDATPDGFTFTDVTSVALGSVQTSNAIAVAGINTAANISVTGGTYSVGCTASFTAVASTITNGQAVCVRHTASASPATATHTALTIGGVSDTFTSTTLAADTTPDAFTFADATNVTPGTTIVSNAITVSGINAPAAISSTGGTYSIGCTSSFTSVASTIANGQTVCVRHASIRALSATASTTLTIGGVSDVFSSTTFASLPPASDFDNDGILNAVETSEARDPFVKDNDVFAVARLFAMQQYRDFLGREGDAGGVDFYANLLTSGAALRANVIESFFNSPEFSGTVSPVARLYFATFLRIPDYPGLQFQVAAYRSGAPLAGIATNFTLSPEFQATYGSLNNAQFVALLYQNILGRVASQPEIDFHVNRLATGASRGDVLVGFSESPEYKQVTANDVYVTMMYVGMLHRAPEQSGFDFWVSYMDAGNPGINLILGFLGAPEYHNRFLPP